MTVSDFYLCKHVLKAICKSLDVDFVDLDITFIEEGKESLYDSSSQSIIISEQDDLAKTLMAIMGVYIGNLKEIFGVEDVDEQRANELLVTTAAIVRDFTYSKEPKKQLDAPLLMTLRQFPFVWIVYRAILAPKYEKTLDDVSVMMGKSSRVEAAKFIVSDTSEYFFFVNTEISSDATSNAFLLFELLQYLKVERVDAVKSLLTDKELSHTFLGFVKASFVKEEDISDFVNTLASLAELNLAGAFDDEFKVRESKVWIKEAQSAGNAGIVSRLTWTVPEILEGMLGAFRNSNTSIKEDLAALTADLWARISKEKQKRNVPDLTIEDMLRVFNEGNKTPNKTLQYLLSEQRIW